LTDTLSGAQWGLTETHPIELAQGFVTALTGASSATDFCRLAVHADFTDSATIGCELVWVDHQAELKPVARYGVTHQIGDTSLWGESLVAQALREQQVKVSNLEPAMVANGARAAAVVPFATGGAPVGAMVLTFSDWPQGTKLLETQEGARLTELMSRLGGFYLQTNGITSGRGLVETPPSNGADGPVLTERQAIVLGFMADGLTNAQIAQQLMLSESSIRQETVRIYRTLGVRTRVEAAKKGQALGLIARG